MFSLAKLKTVDAIKSLEYIKHLKHGCRVDERLPKLPTAFKLMEEIMYGMLTIGKLVENQIGCSNRKNWNFLPFLVEITQHILTNED